MLLALSIGVAQALRQVKMFSSFWMKITAALGLVIGALLLNTKRQASKIKKLKHENEVIHKKDEMRKAHDTFAAKVLADETDEMLKITKEVKSNVEKPSLDDINSL